MIKRCKMLFLLVLFVLTACRMTSYSSPPPVAEIPIATYGNAADFIDLQNPHNRVVVHCKKTAEASAELCADFFEKRGYIRLQEIPYKTANYDFLKTDTYPSRRWRANEATPRW